MHIMYPEAQDSRHTYRWSEYGIRVRSKQGWSSIPGATPLDPPEIVHHPDKDWEGFYALRHCRDPNGKPTRLILTGISYGNPPGELVVHIMVVCDIIKNITGDHPGDPKYNLEPDKSEAAEERAKFLST
jgi:hypothetical protein